MVKTYSTMMHLGTPAPHFNLPDTVSGKHVSLPDGHAYDATLVMFICNHCPFVIMLKEALVALGNDYQDKSVRIIAISSNDPAQYAEDAPEHMKALAESMHFPFPYLYDETQEVAKAYDAACTPDFFIFDRDLKCAYRGQFDGARPGNDVPVTGEDIRAALDDILAGAPVKQTQKPSMGCNIKWRD